MDRTVAALLAVFATRAAYGRRCTAGSDPHRPVRFHLRWVSCPVDVALPEDLSDWTDCTLLHTGWGALGLFVERDFAVQTKGVFRTDNPLGIGLHEASFALVSAGIPDIATRRMNSFGGIQTASPDRAEQRHDRAAVDHWRNPRTHLADEFGAHRQAAQR